MVRKKSKRAKERERLGEETPGKGHGRGEGRRDEREKRKLGKS